MPKTTKVLVGGRDYALSEKVAGVMLEWRKHLRESGVMLIFQQLDQVVMQVVTIIEGGWENIEAEQVVPLARILPVFVNGLTNSIDDVLELLFDYSPEMAADREWLLANAYNSEFIAAFIEVLKLNYPTTALWEMVRGSKVLGTSTNLPTRNGASPGTKKDLVRSKSR